MIVKETYDNLLSFNPTKGIKGASYNSIAIYRLSAIAGFLLSPLLVIIDDIPSIKRAPSHKVAINYWFRHAWECWWSLYPEVVPAISYSGITPGMFYATMVPFPIAGLAGGYYFW